MRLALSRLRTGPFLPPSRDPVEKFWSPLERRRGSAAPSVSTSSPPGSTAATLRARRYSRCPAYSSRAFVCAGSARCHDFLAATVTATLATTALATDTALSVTIVLPQDVQLHVLVYRPRCSACEGRGVRGLQDARGILGEVRTHGMVWDTAHNYSYHTPSLSICISTPLQ